MTIDQIDMTVCPNCGQWQRGDCVNDCIKRGFAPSPFVKTDAGRSKSKHPKERNDCTVRALATVCGVSYDEAYDFIQSEGRASNSAVNFNRIMYGVLDPVIGDPRTVFGFTATRQTFPAVKGQRRMNPATFRKRFPTGRYVVWTARHVFAIIDGVAYDTHRQREDRCIYGAWKFEKR